MTDKGTTIFVFMLIYALAGSAGSLVLVLLVDAITNPDVSSHVRAFLVFVVVNGIGAMGFIVGYVHTHQFGKSNVFREMFR